MNSIDYMLVVATSAVSGGTSGWAVHALMRMLRSRKAREFVSKFALADLLNADAKSTIRHEFLRENDRGEFVPTGELIPDGQDPNQAVLDRSRAEGVSYSAHKVAAV